jgi:flavoprotein
MEIDTTEATRPSILWGITSSGSFLPKIITLMEQVQSWDRWTVDVVMSREAPFVMKYYKLWDRLRGSFPRLRQEQGPNIPFLGGPLQRHVYEFMLVAPVTGNTMAKIAHGIADSLVSNCVAMALKAAVPVLLFPTDQAGVGEEAHLRDGTTLQLFPRQVDLENVEEVRAMDHVTVFSSVEEMRSKLDELAYQ